ncbi:GDH/6PGL endoplasmic bifunctional protein isoform X2 [Clupea harengus]|uniref:GDH/6PGL endoplasmic bifunctional protein isoform X2 n=1 Tax=Clupea harengus TaxID=7950 RepID=A0A6P8FKW5_CLUHA|nr:GDH/6PGL endoplasmic bifunctional protein isoform X2 [Clupea harengus]
MWAEIDLCSEDLKSKRFFFCVGDWCDWGWTMRKATWGLLLLLTCAATCDQSGQNQDGEQKGPSRRGHVSVVVVGSTGDLAKKYLWQGFFNLYASQVGKGYSFSFYGGGLSPDGRGTPLLFEILKSQDCPVDVSDERCALVREQFLRLAQYRQLKTEEDYQALGQHIETQLKQEGMVEAGRLFYLSVPAFAYADIAQRVNRSCRPPGTAWLRVVLEKPFGHDSNSAQELATQLASSLKEDEMFRIDHYLGKQVVSQILPFRKGNRKLLKSIWNKHHIDRMEIVLKETLDAKGRISFYDQYGVIRDVIQNHLTEVMTLLTMSVPKNLTDCKEINRNKLKVFSALHQLDMPSAVLGQYQTYNSEVQLELNKTKDHFSLSPTYAGIAVHTTMPQFDGVPIFLVSGKLLDERVGYARITFKNNVFCAQDQTSITCRPKQIVFYIGQGQLQYPAILVSKNLFKPALVNNGWKEVIENDDTLLFGIPLSDYYIQTPVVQQEAYTELISQVFRGRRDHFVSAESLLASWKFWTPLLNSLKHTFPRPYPGGAANGNLLDFQLQGREVRFCSEALVNMIPQEKTESFQVMQGKYRSADMVSAWSKELVERLAHDLQEAAEESVQEGTPFHLALSGGSSPLALFKQLTQHHYAFPWWNTHVWMADERCVPPNEAESNFRTIHDHLLQHVHLPYFNIHPMPVQLNQRLCVEEDGGALVYEQDIARLVNSSSFSYVLLGVGFDGHTASLFPGNRLGSSGERLVALTESPLKPHQRMSLTFGAINRARRVSVLIMGKGKHELVTQLSRIKDTPDRWPITKIQPVNGRLVWYIDYDALLGQ